MDAVFDSSEGTGQPAAAGNSPPDRGRPLSVTPPSITPPSGGNLPPDRGRPPKRAAGPGLAVLCCLCALGGAVFFFFQPRSLERSLRLGEFDAEESLAAGRGEPLPDLWAEEKNPGSGQTGEAFSDSQGAAPGVAPDGLLDDAVGVASGVAPDGALDDALGEVPDGIFDGLPEGALDGALAGIPDEGFGEALEGAFDPEGLELPFPEGVEPPVSLRDQGIVQYAQGGLAGYRGEEDAFFLLSAWSAEKSVPIRTVSAPVDAGSVAGIRFTSAKYDESLRLVSKTVWQTIKGGIEALRRTVYYYTGGETKNPARQEVFSFGDNTVEETLYTARGLPKSVRLYLLEKGNRRTPMSETVYVYDSAQRVKEKTGRLFGPKGVEIPGSAETIRYTYPGNGKNPTMEVFRDGKLKSSVDYDDEGERVERRQLAGGYSVEITYRDGVLARERYLFQDKEIRRRDY